MDQTGRQSPWIAPQTVSKNRKLTKIRRLLYYVFQGNTFCIALLTLRRCPPKGNDLELALITVCADPGGVDHAVRSEAAWPYRENTRFTFTCDDCSTGGGSITCQSNGQWTTKPNCTGNKNASDSNANHPRKSTSP